MALPMEGWTESTGRPDVYYKYAVETSNRTGSSVHVRLTVTLRLQYYSSYYSFRIAHECKVNGVYAYADIKTDRSYWGHQWEGSYYEGGYGWTYGSYDYDGTAWHGPYTVFDADVPMGADETSLHIVPCLTQPPICGLGGTGIYAANVQDVTNWRGQWGYWRPFGEDEMIGSFTPGQLGYPCDSDGPFLNNRWLQELSGPGVDLGAYPRPANPTNVVISPSRVDVAQLESVPVNARWRGSAASYRIYLSMEEGHGDAALVATVPSTEATVWPHRAFPGISTGDRVWLGVRAVDANGVENGSVAWASPTSYYEVPTRSPSEIDLVTSREEEEMGGVWYDMVSCRGETCTFIYRGMSDGSWPVATYRLLLDGEPFREWKAADARAMSHNGKSWESVGVTFRQSDPRARQVLTLECFDVRGVEIEPESSIDVYRYGSSVWVWSGSSWLEGDRYWVSDGSSWLEGEQVWVRDGGWRS